MNHVRGDCDSKPPEITDLPVPEYQNMYVVVMFYEVVRFWIGWRVGWCIIIRKIDVKNKNLMVRGCKEGAANCIFTFLGNNSLCGYIHLVECLVELIFPSHQVLLKRRILTTEAPKLVL